MAYGNYYSDSSANPYVVGQEDFWEDEERKRFGGDPADAAQKESGGFTSPPTTPPPSSVTQTWNRDKFVQGWRDSSFAATPDAFKQYAAQSQYGAGVQIISPDKFRDADGRVYDIIGNVGTDRAQKRTGYTTDSRYANVTGSKAPAAKAVNAAAPSGPTSASSSVQAAVQPAAVNTVSIEEQRKQAEDEALRQQLIEQLTKRAQQGLAIDRNDPNIRVQADAYSANEERARRNYLADIAEQAGPLANLRGEQRLAAERVGQRTGSFEAELIGRELVAKRTEISDALESMRGMLTTGQEMSLRKELALMDDAIKRLQIKNQSTQFGQNLNEQARQFNADLEFKNRSLAEQSKQAANQLGFNYDSFDWIRSPMNPANMPQ